MVIVHFNDPPPLLPDYKGAVRQLPVLRACHGLHLRALVDIEADGEMRRCGDEWQLKGPVTYIPNPDVVCTLTLLNSHKVSAFMYKLQLVIT